jgi:copper chaperone CopZ
MEETKMFVKIKIFLIVVIALLVICGCSATANEIRTAPAEQTPTEQAAEMKLLRVYEVFGMDCPGCHGGIEKLVKRIPAVEKAEANWEKKQLVVTVKPGHNLDDRDVMKAIKEANFTPGKRIK